MDNILRIREIIIHMTRSCRARMISRIWLVFAVCMASQAWALGVGEWRTLSALGERAQAEAEVFHEPGELIDANCFSLLYPGSGSDFPPIDDARLSIKNTPKGLYLRLESSSSNREPITQIRLKITCGAPQTRDMVLLFSPREHTDAIATAASVIPPEAGSTGLTQIDRAKSTGSGPQKSSGKRAAQAITSKPALHRTAESRPRQPSSRISAQSERPKLVLSGELDPEIVNRLRLTANLRQLPKEASTAEREQLRRLYRSMMQLADLKESQGITPQSPTGGADSVNPPGATPILGVPETGQVTTETALLPANPSPPITPVEVPKATPLPPLDTAGKWWLPLLGIFLLALLLGFWLMRGRKTHRDMPEAIEAMPPIHTVSIKSEPSSVAQDTLETLLKKETAATPVAESPGGSAFVNVRGVTVHSESPSFLTSYRTMLDLADSMMAFGLNNDAADALKEYVEDHPEVAVEPWLKLLDILRQTGKRAEFDQYSLKLRQHFNLDLPGWDAAPSLTGAADARGSDKDGSDLEARFRAAPSPLEAFPHVRDRLVSMWGQPECVAFLQHLMRDNRDGKRRGFPLIVVDDILLLLDITKELTGIDTDASISERPEIFSDTW